jgi:hypothetical protein
VPATIILQAVCDEVRLQIFTEVICEDKEYELMLKDTFKTLDVESVYLSYRGNNTPNFPPDLDRKSNF